MLEGSLQSFTRRRLELERKLKPHMHYGKPSRTCSRGPVRNPEALGVKAEGIPSGKKLAKAIEEQHLRQQGAVEIRLPTPT